MKIRLTLSLEYSFLQTDPYNDCTTLAREIALALTSGTYLNNRPNAARVVSVREIETIERAEES